MLEAALQSSLLGPLLAASVLVVGPGGPYGTIPEALAAARTGDIIEVRGGTHPGGLVVDRSVTLLGVGDPVLDGGGRGTVITLAAPGAVLRGFVIRSSGTDLNVSDAGIAVRAADVTIEENRVEDVLFGISLDDAHGSIVRGNSVRGKNLPPAERGDGLRVWYSSGVLLEGNRVDGGRDCVVWYSASLRMVNNTIEHGRYGLHFMYDDQAEITGNVFRGNSVGAYLMYSRDVRLHGNLLAANRGPSGFGLGLKDVDDVWVEQNWFVDNRVGTYIDNSPRSMAAEGHFRANVFALNDIALTLLPAVTGNGFSENVFRDNYQQVSVQGGGVPRGNRWAEGGRGNYWSDYAGFDADGDGLGDVPYRAETLVGDLMDRRPQLRLFQLGLAADAIEFAARAFPALRPPPKLVDEAPLLSPPTIPPPPRQASIDSRSALGVGLALLATAASVLGLSRANWRPSEYRAPTPADTMALRVEGLTKRFGKVVAVDRLTFTVAAGEAVALWGPNGAGKTTALKCVLGLLPCSGRVAVAGWDALRRGKQARSALGYVPQEVSFHDDLTVRETAAFYGRLKRVSAAHVRERLAALGLEEHAEKPIGALSGGLRQRLALAIALLGDPALLLLDEPTANLDAASRVLVLEVLRGLRRSGTAILLTSHRLEEVEALADRVLVLERGRLLVESPPRALARSLGLRLSMRVRVEPDQREGAVAALRAAGLEPTPNGHAVSVNVLPTEKALPIRVLERAGIPVADFTIEDELDAAGAGTG